MRFHITPPSQRLSEDVLWYLFAFVAAGDSSQAAMIVSHVSSTWRHAAFQSTLLWANITIGLYLLDQKHELAKAHFHRSGKRPIYLTIDATRKFLGSEMEDLIIRHAHRIYRLTVHTKGRKLTNTVWAQLNVHFPVLEEFNACTSFKSGLHVTRKSPEDHTSTMLVPHTPNAVLWDMWKPSGLTTFKLTTRGFWDCPSLYVLRGILSGSAATLQHFEFEGLAPSTFDPDDNEFCPPIKFHQLASLNIAFIDNIGDLLRIFDMPALKSLTLRDYWDCRDYDQLTPALSPVVDSVLRPAQLLRIIGKWKHITHLGLYSIFKMPHDPILKYLQSLSQLESLVLYGINGSEDFVEVLFSQPKHDEIFLPKLKTLMCAPPRSRPDPLDCAHFIRARRANKLPRLEKLTFNRHYLYCLEEFFGSLELLNGIADAVTYISDPIPEYCLLIEEIGRVVNGRMEQLDVIKALPMI